MPSISYDAFAAWSNYHLTIGDTPVGGLFPQKTIESLARFHAADLESRSGLTRFGATATTLLRYLADLKRKQFILEQVPSAGLVGRGWSFAPLIGSPYSQLLCEGLSGIGELNAGERHAGCSVGVDKIALASGGTRLRELVSWAQQRRLSIMTSGTHLGMSVAGGFGTASHGSRLYFGGMQNMVLGMHLVVGEVDHVWIDRNSDPVLSDAGLKALENEGSPPRLIRDDKKFDDALIHLGAMGIVNGVALKLVDDKTYALMMREQEISEDWLKLIEQEKFHEIARLMKCEVAPIFYELTLNPHSPYEGKAAHIMYFPTRAGGTTPGLSIIRPIDAIGRTGDGLVIALRAKSFGDGGDDFSRAFEKLFQGQNSAFDFYKKLADFAPNDECFDPDGEDTQRGRWSELHKDEITANIPGALYNASFAIPIDKVSTAVPLICDAVRDLPPTFVFTLRFVFESSGTLAFTRFPRCAVIEIDGVSPLICRLFAEVYPEVRDQFRTLGNVVGEGAHRIRAAFDGRIDYSMHWAKLGDLDRAKVRSDFGDPSQTGTPANRWRTTRRELIGDAGETWFWNTALRNYGLV